jgi:hypothetical protein
MGNSGDFMGKLPGDWSDFLFVRVVDLICHAKHTGKLAVMQRIAVEKSRTYAKDSELRFHIREKNNGKAHGQPLLFDLSVG